MTVNNSKIKQSVLTINGVTFEHVDIFNVVNDFYYRIQQDPILQVPFYSVHDWPEHVERITHFWWIRFGGKPYLFSDYNPVAKHFFAGFNGELLARWLSIFKDTLNTHLKPEQAELWKNISERMGESLTIKNEMFRREYEKSQPK
ncbi:MAG: group III truncated hemoglobin [Bdellovibrionaceae bacterium]|nr:group III truncated hemoglobin [Bdellovibrio sp.]